MKPLQTALYVLCCIALTALGIACVSQAQFDAGHALAAAATAATDPAGPGGAVITPEENQVLADLYTKLAATPGFDWKAAGAGVMGALASIFPLLRLVPNKFIVGHQEAKALDKAAGIS